MNILLSVKKYIVSSFLVGAFVVYVVLQRTNDAVLQKKAADLLQQNPQQNIVADVISTPVVDVSPVSTPPPSETTLVPVPVTIPPASVGSQIKRFINRFEDGEDDDGRVFIPKSATAPTPVPVVSTPVKQTSTPVKPATVPVVSPTVVKTTTGMYKDGTYNGSVVFVRDGDLQTQAIIQGGKLADVKFLILPNGSGYSSSITSYALPILRTEAISAQSANVNVVSQATLTSGSFRESLSSALALAKK